MSKACDHKSVGIFVWRQGKLLLIERARPPYGFAVPAGHVDQDASYESAARRELKEETGLEATSLKLLIDGRKDNPCRRDGGTWHYWKLYSAEAIGEMARSIDETKSAIWASKDEVQKLADDSKLEPVMAEWFKQLNIIK